MTRKLVPIYSAAWRAIVVLLAVEISIVSVLRYVTRSEAPPPPIVANAYADPFLILHVISGVIALLVGPLQFARRIRNRWPAFHRATGLTYVATCAIGAPTGFVLALGSTAGPIASAGFGTQALLLPVFTWLGWRAAVERRFGSHREWMLRSYALIAAAITLRLMIPAAFLLELDFVSAYRVIAWLCWATNLALVEIVIRRSRAAIPFFENDMRLRLG
jgi:uncharacterized membrane protein